MTGGESGGAADGKKTGCLRGKSPSSLLLRFCYFVGVGWMKERSVGWVELEGLGCSRRLF
jgi:hypothetical protein